MFHNVSCYSFARQQIEPKCMECCLFRPVQPWSRHTCLQGSSQRFSGSDQRIYRLESHFYVQFLLYAGYGFYGMSVLMYGSIPYIFALNIRIKDF